MSLDGLYIAKVLARGRGVFSTRLISAGQTIEICPVIVLPPKDYHRIHESHLHDYYFLWEVENSTAIALGFGSLYNHADENNADYEMDFEGKTISMFALRDIEAGEEITIDYTDGKDRSTLWF